MVVNSNNVVNHDGFESEVKDMSLAEWGRREYNLAEIEMPGLMGIREEYKADRVLDGARISGSLHMTIQTGVLIETLHALGAQVVQHPVGVVASQRAHLHHGGGLGRLQDGADHRVPQREHQSATGVCLPG